MGPQGSGKSTQGKLLAEFLAVPYISTGETFRKMAEQDNEMGRKIKNLLDRGYLIDDDLTIEVVKKRLGQKDCSKGFVMDGYPRTKQQVELFDPGFDRAFYLELSDDEAIKRLLERKREDDTEELIKERLSIYHQQTEPLLGHFKQKGLLQKINGIGSIEEIQERIRQGL